MFIKLQNKVAAASSRPVPTSGKTWRTGRMAVRPHPRSRHLLASSLASSCEWRTATLTRLRSRVSGMAASVRSSHRPKNACGISEPLTRLWNFRTTSTAIFTGSRLTELMFKVQLLFRLRLHHSSRTTTSTPGRPFPPKSDT